jgi:hypothetical protein
MKTQSSALKFLILHEFAWVCFGGGGGGVGVGNYELAQFWNTDQEMTTSL